MSGFLIAAAQDSGCTKCNALANVVTAGGSLVMPVGIDILKLVIHIYLNIALVVRDDLALVILALTSVISQNSNIYPSLDGAVG